MAVDGDSGVLLVFGQKLFSVAQLTCDATSLPRTAEPHSPTGGTHHTAVPHPPTTETHLFTSGPHPRTDEPHPPSDETCHTAEPLLRTTEPNPLTHETHPPIAEAQYRLCTIVGPVELSDWILDAVWLVYRDPSSFSVAFMTAHNVVLVYVMTPESTSIRTYLCEVNCILYPKKFLVIYFFH